MPADTLSETASVPAIPRPVHPPEGRQPSDRLTLARVTEWLEARAMFVIAIGAVLVLSLLGIPTHLNQDGWLALTAGRLIAGHGIPQHDYFAHLTFGVRWVDQQWLAQLLMYEVQHVGGLRLLTVLYVFVTGFAFGAAVAAARKLAGEDLHVLMAAVPGAFFYLVTAVSIRTQGLAYPLFVATLWLLASEVRSPVRRRRVYLVFPTLVLWGNLHGSATLGAGLAALYGVVLLLDGLCCDGMHAVADRRAWAFIVISPLALLATPYGLDMIHYYSVTILNPQFSQMVTEWKPVTSVTVIAVPLFVVIVLTALAIIRVLRRALSSGATGAERSGGIPLFDLLTLIVLAVGAVMAVRNVTWFGLALMMLLPRIITQSRGGEPAPLRRARVNRMLAGATVLLTAIVSVAVLAEPGAWFTSGYPTKSITTLRALITRHPSARILADVRYADWLIWEDPRLFSGRVAYDTSFELLTKAQLAAIADLAAKTGNTRGLLDSYPIWMLNPGNAWLNKRLLRRPHVHVVTRNHKVVIATHQT